MFSTDNWSKSTKPIYSDKFSKIDSSVEIKCIQFVILISNSRCYSKKLLQLERDSVEGFLMWYVLVKGQAKI